MAMDTSVLKDGQRAADHAASVALGDDARRAIWRGKIHNIELAWQEFESRKLQPESMPFRAIVELTQNCNFKCIMCPQSWEDKFKRYDPALNMPMETFVKVADELFPKAIFIDLRGFGETTILPYWPEVVDYLERFPYVEWHLVTNLSLPRDETWDKMIRLGFSLGISCDGATAETFEAIRRRGKFDRVRHNLGVIRDSRRRHGQGFAYLLPTVQKKNLHELRAIVEMAAELEIEEVQFKIVQPGGHDESLDSFTPDVIAGHAGEALAVALDRGIRVTFNDWRFTRGLDPARVEQAARWRERRTPPAFPANPPFDPRYWHERGFHKMMENLMSSFRVSEQQRCFKPFSYTYVNYLAEVGTCNHMMYPNPIKMGDLRFNSLREIWNGTKYQDFRHQLLTATPADKRCQWCFKHRLDD